MLKSFIAISLGASLGATLRWGLGLALDSLFSVCALGTLSANLLGGYGMGLALGAFALHPGLGAEWRLLCITGFLGSLTTFSAFSGEVTLLLQQSRYAPAFATMGLHLGGSLLMTFLGLESISLLRRLMA